MTVKYMLLVRHGETRSNREGVFMASASPRLTTRGRAQARLAAEWIAARHRPAEVVTSPYRRARETARVLGDRLLVAVRVEEALRDRSYGELAGRPYAAVAEYPDYDPQRFWQWRPPGGGETLVEVARRAGPVVDRLLAEDAHREVALVAHGAVMAALWWHLTGEWSREGIVANGGLVVVEHREARCVRIRVADPRTDAPAPGAEPPRGRP